MNDGREDAIDAWLLSVVGFRLVVRQSLSIRLSEPGR